MTITRNYIESKQVILRIITREALIGMNKI